MSGRRKSRSRAEYLEKARALKRFHNFSFPLNRKLSPNQKAAVTRQWKRLGSTAKEYQRAEKDPEKDVTTKLVKVSSERERRRLKKTFGDRVTNKGVLVRIPATPKKDLKRVKVDVNGDFLKMQIGIRANYYVPIDITELVGPDRERYFESVLENFKIENGKTNDPEEITYVINGYPMKRRFDFSDFEDEMAGTISGYSTVMAELHDLNSGMNVTGLIFTYFEPINQKQPKRKNKK